ncbi:Glycoside hydrolase, family 28 [Candidatus Sulfopaludibacter sp. SbA3]|nr:Glycoside hydrolase, family 28 [Candidatus Sulfopaludibacter sp. SbA3]
MPNFNGKDISRRKWMSVSPAVSGLLAVSQAQSQSPVDKSLGAKTYNVRDFGAKGDGTSLDTVPLQAAIDACHKDQGGTVLVPAGVFVIGTIEMKSNVTLHLAAGGKLLGSADGKQYHAVDEIPLHGDTTLEDGNWALIFAVKAQNFTVEGPGTIDGQGAQFRSPSRGVSPPSGIGGSHRPYHLLFHQCQNFSVRDIFLKDCAFHSVRINQSSYGKLEGIRIYNRVNHNNDGFHFVSAQHVAISNCDVQCQDDACALFGSCQFITVTNCSFSTRWSVFRFGGGTAENISVSNCLIYDTYGCPIKIRGGEGPRLENISFSNIVMKNVTGPISICLGPRNQRPGAGQTEQPQTQGVVRNISFRGIHATVSVPVQFPDVPFTSGYNPGEIKSCIGLSGVGAFIENISFDDVHVTFPGGGTAQEGALRDVPKVVGEYYAAGVFPAYALYARNVRGLTLNNVRFEVAGEELRPAIVFDHVDDATVNGLTLQADPKAESIARFIDSRDILLSATRVNKPGPVFLRVEGAASQGITIDGGDLSKAAKPLSIGAGAADNSVKVRE